MCYYASIVCYVNMYWYVSIVCYVSMYWYVSMYCIAKYVLLCKHVLLCTCICLYCLLCKHVLLCKQASCAAAAIASSCKARPIFDDQYNEPGQASNDPRGVDILDASVFLWCWQMHGWSHCEHAWGDWLIHAAMSLCGPSKQYAVVHTSPIPMSSSDARCLFTVLKCCTGNTIHAEFP